MAAQTSVAEADPLRQGGHRGGHQGAHLDAHQGSHPAARSGAGTRRCTLRLPAALARRLDACCARQPDTPRATLLLRLLEAGLRQAESPPRASAAAAHAPLPHRRLRAQSAVYLPASPYAALHGLRPWHHLALEQSRGAALEGEGGEAVGLPAGAAIGATGAAWPGSPDYRLEEE